MGHCGWSCPQCPAGGESLVPGARAGSVPTVHQVSLRSGRSLRVVGLVTYALKGIMLLELAGWPSATSSGRYQPETGLVPPQDQAGQWVMLIAVDDAEGADVMPSRPNEHSSLGVPVGGCSHHLKCDRLTRPVGRQRLEIPDHTGITHTPWPRQNATVREHASQGSPSQERMKKHSTMWCGHSGYAAEGPGAPMRRLQPEAAPLHDPHRSPSP